MGRFLRINNRTDEKVAVYECGEPAVGSGFVQFDLRFYVVALIFLITHSAIFVEASFVLLPR